MMNNINWLESNLARLVACRYGVLTGRASSALYIALKSLGINEGKVALSAISCPSPATIPLYCGLKPVFSDVEKDGFNMCANSLDRLCDKYGDVRVVIIVHLYGYPCNMGEILRVARKHGLFVVEDVAQSLGAEYTNKKVGSFGDVSIVSCGQTKLLDAGGGGLAATNNILIAERMRQEQEKLPEKPLDLVGISDIWKTAYHKVRNMCEISVRYNALFIGLHETFKDMYVFKYGGNSDELIGLVYEVDKKIKRRREKAEIYRRYLRHDVIRHPGSIKGAVPWRYPIFVPADRRKKITNSMWSDRRNCSTWYPSLHRWYSGFENYSDDDLKNALDLEASIVNLWLDDKTKEEDIMRDIELMNTYST